jgi:hypothetical protein
MKLAGEWWMFVHLSGWRPDAGCWGLGLSIAPVSVLGWGAGRWVNIWTNARLLRHIDGWWWVRRGVEGRIRKSSLGCRGGGVSLAL